MTTDALNTTYGSAFIGAMFGAVMYGVTLVQTLHYYRHYPEDSKGTKFLVFVLWLADTLHLIWCTMALYWYLVLNFGNLPVLALNHWTINLQTDCNGLIGLLVELFFANRVYKVSKNWLLAGIISVLASIHFSLGVYFTAEAFILKEYAKYQQLTWVTSTGLGSAAAADIIIAVSMVYFLLKSRTGFEKTDSMISVLIMYAINTGLLTSICATIAVVAFAIMPTNFIWLAFFWVLGKFYVNSLLASLNSREHLRSRTQDPNQVHLGQMRSQGSEFGPKRPTRIPLAITVNTVKEHTIDYIDHASSPRSDKSDKFSSSSSSV